MEPDEHRVVVRGRHRRAGPVSALPGGLVGMTLASLRSPTAGFRPVRRGSQAGPVGESTLARNRARASQLVLVLLPEHLRSPKLARRPDQAMRPTGCSADRNCSADPSVAGLGKVLAQR